MVKKSCRRISLLLILCLFLTVAPWALAEETGSADPLTAHRDIATDSEWDALRYINTLRLAEGKPPLAMAAALQPAAALRALELDDSFSQIRPDGRLWHSVIADAGIAYYPATELIARPAISGQRVFELWLNCESSRAHLLGDFSHIALGHNVSSDSWCALLISSEAPHSLFLLPTDRDAHDLPFGGSLERLELVAVTEGVIGLSYIPITNAVTDFDPKRAGTQMVTFSLGELRLQFRVFVSFSDVDRDFPYYFDIRYVTANGLFNGISPSDFAPDAPMTRAMFVTVLGRLAELMGKPITGDHSQFADVQDGRWYTPYIGWAAERGIAQGFDGIFRLEDPVTREQMATFLLRFIQYAQLELPLDDVYEDEYVHECSYAYECDYVCACEHGYECPYICACEYICEYEPQRPPYADRDSVSPWALEAVDLAVALGLINLTDRGNFAPHEYATRAQVARALSVLAQEHMGN